MYKNMIFLTKCHLKKIAPAAYHKDCITCAFNTSGSTQPYKSTFLEILHSVAHANENLVSERAINSNWVSRRESKYFMGCSGSQDSVCDIGERRGQNFGTFSHLFCCAGQKAERNGPCSSFTTWRALLFLWKDRERPANNKSRRLEKSAIKNRSPPT